MKIDRSRLKRVKAADAVARVLITLGGVAVIGSVIAVIVLLTSVVFPLFAGTGSEVRVESSLPKEVSPADVLGVGVDLVIIGQGRHEDALTSYALSSDGTFHFFDFPPPEKAGSRKYDPRDYRPVLLKEEKVAAPGGSGDETVEAVYRANGSEYTLLWSNGAASVIEVPAEARFDELGRRSVDYRLRELVAVEAQPGPKPVRAVARASEDGPTMCAILYPDNRIAVVRETAVEGVFGRVEKKTERTAIDSGIPGRVTAMTVNRKGDTLFVGTENGRLARWKFSRPGVRPLHETVELPGGAAVTSMAMVFGDVSLAVGDAGGNVTTWFPVRTEEGKAENLSLIHTLPQHAGPVLDILPSQRNKSILSLDEGGAIFLDYMTSGRHLLTLAGDGPLAHVGYSPRGNATVALEPDGGLRVWQIDSPHPEISWGTLFGKVWYDNHNQPKYMWQSSGTDEPKFSLVPVIFGTLKATLYAMFFAVPLALAAAMYVSHFTTPGFKRAIKPVVEVMAAVPTVVVGFLILLWAGPLVGRWVVGVFASLLTIPITFVLFMVFWQYVRRFDCAKWVENGYEFLVLLPVVAIGAAVGIWLSVPLESLLFGGDFRQWLFDTMGTRYDQLNSMVVAFGLGFAVIPIIFSISEDSLSDIPRSLTAASLALGASRWQTVWRVILPSASPGIFAAVMIGFGRAVGETMIVFMATGNTPILDWSPFNGFRTLSANIAVEISEAPRDGTLYRVLFLCAVILFLMTFVLNTVAELVRVRLRKKFGRY